MVKRGGADFPLFGFGYLVKRGSSESLMGQWGTKGTIFLAVLSAMENFSWYW